MKKITAYFISIVFMTFLACSALAGPIKDSKTIDEPVTKIATESGFETSSSYSLSRTVAMLIQAFLGILAMIFLILIILAGFKWMMAQGDETKAEEALASIRHAVIGLAIIVASYAITYFVFKYMPWGGEKV